MSFAQPSPRKRPGTTNSPARHHLESLEPRQFLSSVPLFAPMHGHDNPHVTTARAAVTGTLTGQVTDTNGNPIANATVRLQGVSGHRHSHLRVTTDASGNYALTRVLAGDYVILAGRKGYLPAASDTFTVAAGDNTAPTVQLTALVYGTVTGQITDGSGNPVANAFVRLQPASASTSTSEHEHSRLFAITDAQGNYTIDHVLAGDYTASAIARGYQPGTSDTFTVAEGGNTAPAVQLTALSYGTVTGQITDADGNPLANARVRIRPAAAGDSMDHRGHGLYAITDADGNYSINHILAGDYVVAASDRGYQSNTSDTFTVSAGDNTAPTVQLSALVYGNVTGQVTDASGNPLANARIILRPAAASTGGMYDDHGPIFFATTDDQGNYSLTDVLAGDHIVIARLRGYQTGTSDTFTIGAGDNTAPTLQLTPRA